MLQAVCTHLRNVNSFLLEFPIQEFSHKLEKLGSSSHIQVDNTGYVA
jgi:hypothetical protein